jgi:hypothetical protein
MNEVTSQLSTVMSLSEADSFSSRSYPDFMEREDLSLSSKQHATILTQIIPIHVIPASF